MNLFLFKLNLPSLSKSARHNQVTSRNLGCLGLDSKIHYERDQSLRNFMNSMLTLKDS